MLVVGRDSLSPEVSAFTVEDGFYFILIVFSLNPHLRSRKFFSLHKSVPLSQKI